MTDNQHTFFVYKGTAPKTSDVSELVARILNHGKSKPLSVSALRRTKSLTIAWRDKKGNPHTKTFSFSDAIEYARKNRLLDPNVFSSTYILRCPWLDSPLTVGMNMPPMSDSTGTFGVRLNLMLGAGFPITPALDREGVAVESFQVPMQQNILRLRRRLVSASAQFFDPHGDWINDLRSYLVECVSIVELTLHQLYFQAKYSPMPGWAFDAGKVGAAHGRRIQDKFGWIGMITGRPLDNAALEIAAFSKIRSIRNHIVHFDPPCFAYTGEDVVSWLNYVPRLGRLLWRIRDRLSAQLSSSIVEMILAAEVDFRPRDLSRSRHPQPHTSGYASSIWPQDVGGTS